MGAPYPIHTSSYLEATQTVNTIMILGSSIGRPWSGSILNLSLKISAPIREVTVRSSMMKKMKESSYLEEGQPAMSGITISGL